MADLSSFAQTVTNAGANGAVLTDNYLQFKSSQSDVGREIVVTIARTNGNGGLPNSVLQDVIDYMTTSHGVSGAGDSAFTVAALGTADGSAIVNSAAAISGGTATETVYVRLQGTGNLTVGTADMGIANVTVAKVAEFAPLT